MKLKNGQELNLKQLEMSSFNTNVTSLDRIAILKKACLENCKDLYSLIEAAKNDIKTVFFVRYLANDYEISFKDISLYELNLIYGKGSSFVFTEENCPQTKLNRLAVPYLSIAEWMYYEKNHTKIKLTDFLRLRNEKLGIKCIESKITEYKNSKRL